MSLSPWPADATELRSAVESVALELNLKTPYDSDGNLTDNGKRAQRLGSVSSRLVERYANSAPSEVRSEAVLRCAAYLNHRIPFSAVRVGNITISNRRPINYQSALFLSGGAALLSPWKVRRAGVIG